MKAIDLIQAINGEYYHAQKACDKWVLGDPQKEIRRVAVCMFPTLRVLREVTAWVHTILIVMDLVLKQKLSANSLSM